MFGSLLHLVENPLKLDNFLFLSPSHIVGVAGSTEASCIVLLVRVPTVGSIVFSSVKVITVIAHSFRVVFPVMMGTVRDFHHLSSIFKISV